jgi:hypothetical protein
MQQSVLFVVEWWHKQFQFCVSGVALFMIFNLYGSPQVNVLRTLRKDIEMDILLLPNVLPGK